MWIYIALDLVGDVTDDSVVVDSIRLFHVRLDFIR